METLPPPADDPPEDLEAFDAFARSFPPGQLLDRLIAELPIEKSAELEGLVPAPDGRLEVGPLAKGGRPAFWIATKWVLGAVPGGAPKAPVPQHEQWDALVEVNKEQPEAAWFVAELYARLEQTQASVGRRILVGVERRFGERGWEIFHERAAGAPLAGLLPPQSSPSS